MPRIFLSYRRSGAAEVAGRIYGHLAALLGSASIHTGTGELPPGTDARKALAAVVRSCDIVLAVVDHDWERDPEVRNSFGPVHVALGVSLPRERIRVIPLLVHRSALPDPSLLHPRLRPLCYRSPLVVREPPDFDQDMRRLVAAIEQMPELAASGSPRRRPAHQAPDEPASPSLRERVIVVRERGGCSAPGVILGAAGALVRSVFGTLGRLLDLVFGTVIRQILRSTVAVVTTVVVALLFGLLALLFVLALVQSDGDIGAAFASVGAQIEMFIRSLLPGVPDLPPGGPPAVG